VDPSPTASSCKSIGAACGSSTECCSGLSCKSGQCAL
jgi:hypothetical protein